MVGWCSTGELGPREQRVQLAFGGRGDVGDVTGQQLAVAHHESSVDDDVAHVGRGVA